MGKLNASLLRYLTNDDIAILHGIEMGMKNHELVSGPLALALSKLKHGGSHVILKKLCQNRLLCYERGRKYDGYRLTNLGYDYLALHDLTKRNVISSFGTQIGVGKESNIYTVCNDAEEQYCLKLHRLGRTCFRKVTEKRDYHKHAKSLSWLYLSKLSATKEFAYMKALCDAGFPVPKPISFNRHCVVMELIEGTLLNHILELEDPEKLYDQLMELILRLANTGLIHGDFNEFNIIVTGEENPVIIDFPQMLSTEHADAEMYFDRDVNCIRTFFRKRFGYESELFPKFSDIDRICSLDAQVHCTGFTKKMAKILNIEYGLENESSESDEDNAEESDVLKRNDLVENDISESLSSMSLKKDNDEVSNCGMTPSDDDSPDSDELSVASTRNSSEVRKILKQQMKKQNMKKLKRNCHAKGEASAVRRSRQENANHIKQSQVFWNM